MKFCTHCGNEISEDAVVCVKCGCSIVPSDQTNNSTTTKTNTKSKLQVSLILGIVGIVFAWLFALVGHIASIIGIILGIKEYKETNEYTLGFDYEISESENEGEFLVEKVNQQINIFEEK